MLYKRSSEPLPPPEAGPELAGGESEPADFGTVLTRQAGPERALVVRRRFEEWAGKQSAGRQRLLGLNRPAEVVLDPRKLMGAWVPRPAAL